MHLHQCSLHSGPATVSLKPPLSRPHPLSLRLGDRRLDFLWIQKWLGALFERIPATDSALVKEVHPNGCLTWDEMKDLATTEELGFFNGSSNKDSLRYWPYMMSRWQHWGDGTNMKKLVADRIAPESSSTGQATISDSTGSPNAKRNIADTSNDHDTVSKEISADVVDDGETCVAGAREPAMKRFRDAPTEQEERAAMKEKNTRRANDSGRSDQMNGVRVPGEFRSFSLIWPKSVSHLFPQLNKEAIGITHVEQPQRAPSFMTKYPISQL